MYIYEMGQWEEGARWASGGSCGGPTIYVHLVSGSRVPGGPATCAREQGAEWEGSTAGSKYQMG